MKTFRVYRHPILGLQAVKDGFSWPGFFFTVIWALTKKLWLHACVFAGIYLFLGLLQSSLLLSFLLRSTDDNLVQLFFFIFDVFISIYIGYSGNQWRVKNLHRRGFELVGTLQAATPDAALANFIMANKPS